MKPQTVIDTTKVVKLIDPLDVSAYRMKMIYDNRNERKSFTTPNVGSKEKMLREAKIQSMFPSIYR
jgi:hypothetical protein